MRVVLIRWLVTIAFGSMLALLMTVPIVAEDQPLTVQGSQTMRENLQKKVGVKVTLQLSSGQELSGKVAEVGENVAHLSELTGKEFYDAVVWVDHISALVVRVRDK
ncbi:MAG TPA: hypothetical protein VNN62_25095 [Methylomirabilota bacterium]|jgi:hypothetical protein|nr:hypothetical protein [Methylomirabilota bacterium]